MKVIMCMAVTANGFIAKEDDDTSFVSSTEWDSFRSVIKRAGNMIIGRRTYEIMVKGNEFKGFDNVKVVVLTSKSLKGVETASSPAEAVKLLKGFKEIVVAGGGKTNAAFMNAGLIDEVYLDVEPVVFGKGIKLFNGADFEAKLELIETKKLSKNEIQLHYKVIK